MSEARHDASDGSTIDIVIVVHARTPSDLQALERTQISVEAQALSFRQSPPASGELSQFNVEEAHKVSKIIVDNASNLEIPNRPGWRIERLAQNNMGAARDFALRVSNASWIAFVDADVELPLEWLKALCLSLKSEPEIWGVASSNTPPQHETAFHASLELLTESWLGHLGSPQSWRPKSVSRVRHLSTSAVLFRRACLIGVGGFDARFSRVAEDLELGVRASRAGARFLLLPAPLVVHRQSPDWASWIARMFRYGWGQIEVWRVHPFEILSRKLLPLLAAWVGFFLVAVSVMQASPWPFCFAMLLYATFLAANLRRVWTPTGLRALLLGLVTQTSYAMGMWLGQWGLVRNPVASSKDRGSQT